MAYKEKESEIASKIKTRPEKRAYHITSERSAAFSGQNGLQTKGSQQLCFVPFLG